MFLLCLVLVASGAAERPDSLNGKSSPLLNDSRYPVIEPRLKLSEPVPEPRSRPLPARPISDSIMNSNNNYRPVPEPRSRPLPARSVSDSFMNSNNKDRPLPEPRKPSPLPAPDSSGTYKLSDGIYYIKSKGYPGRYPNNYKFNWVLQGNQPSQIISISCKQFNLKRSRKCKRDFLSINGKKFCGRKKIAPIDANPLKIRFRTNRRGRRSGFYCKIAVSSVVVITLPPVTPSIPWVSVTLKTTTTTSTSTPATTTTPVPDKRCCGKVNYGSRIVGGVETMRYEYPWQAGIVKKHKSWIWCGGSVINTGFILTAAHCTMKPKAGDIEVLLGEHKMFSYDGESRYGVERIVNHPMYYSAAGSGYDFSLLKLTKIIKFPANNYIAPVCLPTAGNLYSDVEALVTGWGTTTYLGHQSSTLLETTVRTMTNQQCKRSYYSLTNTMLCAGVKEGGKDACQGDSGGPLVTQESGRYSVIGVVSWGTDCGLAMYPGVYSRVTEVLGWITTETSGVSDC